MSMKDSGKNTDGINTLDLMSMSVPVRRITRIMLRKTRMPYTEICAKLDELPKEKKLSKEAIDKALEELVELGWMDRLEENGEVIYQVRIKKKEGSEVTRSSERSEKAVRSATTMKDLWDAVEKGDKASGGGLKAKREMSDIHQKVTKPEKKSRSLFGFLRKKKKN